MLKDLIARAFCREISRKLRRMGILGAIVSIPLALYIERPLEISVATSEAEIVMTSARHSIDQMFLHLQRHLLDTRHMQPRLGRQDR